MEILLIKTLFINKNSLCHEMFFFFFFILKKNTIILCNKELESWLKISQKSILLKHKYLLK